MAGTGRSIENALQRRQARESQVALDHWLPSPTEPEPEGRDTIKEFLSCWRDQGRFWLADNYGCESGYGENPRRIADQRNVWLTRSDTDIVW